ncbi:choline dehydrogenase [Favolaschia claudopus]|uniref:Choline dehydrogenase n=1 Tax=Favolaschia claudopus TaxID=2862362 RepID=A0AAW0DRE3_9AGAR
MRLLFVLAASLSVYALQKRSTTDPAQLSGKTFDFVIVGGGTAGLALAGRLAEWSNTTIAVIEAGSDGSEFQDQITIPGMSYINTLTGTSFDWQYNTTPQANVGGNVINWPRGKGLGGSSAINGGFWCRGSADEYDAWNTLQNGQAGAQDWGWETMQAYMKKAENFTPMSDANAGMLSLNNDVNAHGTTGPIHASYSSFQFPQLSTWIPTLAALGLSQPSDPASGTNVGVSFVPSIINPVNGSRSDSNFGYIAPFDRTNLIILTGYQVTKINWNDTTTGAAIAGGVTFAASAESPAFTVNAAKEVILAGGVVGSAQVLQLSGVGPKPLITSLGMSSVIDLPGVGANLQDHLSASIFLNATDPNTWAALKSDQNLWNQQLAIWRENGTGMWTYWNEATAYPTMSHIMGSNASSWVAALNVPAAVATTSSAAALDPTVAAGVQAQYATLAGWAASSSIGQVEIIFNMFGAAAGEIGIQFCLQHPFSRGSIQINSTSAFNPPVINPNYLSVSYDADIMRAAFRYVRQIMSTAPLSGLIAIETFPGPGTVADVDVNFYIAHNAVTEYHPTGTNSMLPLSLGGVVNTSLVVYGTTNVRVVDVSIVPLTVSSHTMTAAYGIAERAADLIKATYSALNLSPGINDSNPDSGDSGGDHTRASTNGLTTDMKVAIIVSSIVGVIAVIAAIFILRHRNTDDRPRPLPPRKDVSNKDALYANRKSRPYAPVVPVNQENSAHPSQTSVGTSVTLAHSNNIDHGQQQLYGVDPYAPYAAAHERTADGASLYPPNTPMPAAPYPDPPDYGHPQPPLFMPGVAPSASMQPPGSMMAPPQHMRAPSQSSPHGFVPPHHQH